MDQSPKKEVAPVKKNKNIWIIKPGENSNRGHGIRLSREFNEIKTYVDNIANSNEDRIRSVIIQKYIDNPLLI